jgi:carboxylesterase type B
MSYLVFLGPLRTNNLMRFCRPSAVHPVQALDMELSIIQQRLPKPDITLSDTECLNLNVTVPDGGQGRKLPVFLFIHGGGFAIGSNSWPHLDQARIVQFSAQKDLPVIGVVIK